MPGYTLKELKGYVHGLKEGGERSVGISWVKRRTKRLESYQVRCSSRPARFKAGLPRGQKLGLSGPAAGKSPGRPPIMDDTAAKKMRGWLSRSPKNFGFKSVRRHLGAAQEGLHGGGTMASDGTVRGAHAPPSVLVPQVKARPPQVRLRGGAERVQERGGRAHAESGPAWLYHSGV